MNIMSNLANKAKVGTMVLATMGDVGLGIKNAMRPTLAEETKQAELAEKLISEIINGNTTNGDYFIEARNKELDRFKEADQKYEKILKELSKGISEDRARLSAALKAYNLPIDSLKHLK